MYAIRSYYDPHTEIRDRIGRPYRLAADIMKRYPRSSLPELADYEGPTAFEKWAIV